MKRDNQWRPSEHRNKGYAPYQRHKLKDANWVTPEEAATISKRCNKWRRNGIWDREPDWDLERKLINKYVNKPYDMFIKTWHERTKRLRKQGVLLELRYIKPTMTDNPSTWDEFYVDTEGIIRKNDTYRWRFNKNKKPIKVVEKEIVKYRLHEEIYNENRWCQTPFYGILSVLRKYFSTTDYNDIINNGIDAVKFNKLVDRSMNSGINSAIEKWARKHNKELCENNPHAYRGTRGWCPYDSFKDLFVADYSESIYRYIYPGTAEYSRITAEQNDATNKARREYKQQNEEFISGLLHNIETDRKAKEDEINRQKIIKHGFDENESFRGPEYHGKKRKRRKNNNWAIES